MATLYLRKVLHFYFESAQRIARYFPDLKYKEGEIFALKKQAMTCFELPYKRHKSHIDTD